MNLFIAMKCQDRFLNVILVYSTSLFLLIPSFTYATENALLGDNAPSRFTVQFEKEPLTSVLRVIEEKSGLMFAYDATLLENNHHNITLKVENGTIEQVLNEVTRQASMAFKMSGKTIILYKPKEPVPKKDSRKPGILTGKVTDEKGEPLPGATIWIGAIKTGTMSDLNGLYRIKLAPGTYTIEVSYVSYQKRQITDVVIKQGQKTPLDILLKSETSAIGEVTVTGNYRTATVEALYAKQKESISLSDGISAEQIKALPANNVAQVLKRVSGLTVKDNKFVTVRGMSERYNNVQLNNASLPSTEPNRRNFSFDIIPAGLVSNVVIYKTFTPDLPAEFSGGMIRVSTIDVPDKPFLTLSAGTGFRTNTTGKAFRTTKRFRSDYFGGGTERSWFNTQWSYDEFNKYDAESSELNSLNAKVPNHWGIYQYTGQPVQSYALSVGKPWGLASGNTLGVVAAATYRHEEKTEGFKARYRANTGDTTAYANTYTFVTSLGGIANLSWHNRSGHKIAWRNLYNRKFSLATTEQEVSDLDGDGSTYEYYSKALINTLWQTRIDGSHELWGRHLKLDWFADYNQLEREQPDDRSSVASIQEWLGDRQYRLSYDMTGSFPTSGLFIFSTLLEETRKNVGGDLETDLNLLGHLQKIKVGYAGTFRHTSYEQVGLKILKKSTSTALDGAPDYELADPENFLNDQLYYKVSYASSSTGDQYSGDQDIHAAYVMAELVPFRPFSINGGVRTEKAIMDVKTITRVNTSDASNPIRWVDTTLRYTEMEYLPSLTLIYQITPQINIRAAYSKTLARPDFRERSHYKYYDLAERAEIMGNGGLEQSYTQNYDIRAEWYPAPGEVISLSAFYKDFKKPVELVSYKKADGGFRFMYFNLESSTLKGVELDLRKSLAFLAPDVLFLQNLYLTGNTSWMQGDVTYNADKLGDEAQDLEYEEGEEGAGIDAYRERPLQGLSPYIVNAGFSYQGDRLGFGLSYNRSGRKLILAGYNNETDEYEKGRDVIDIQWSFRFLEQKLELKLNISDLLQQDKIRYRNKNKDDVNLTYDNDPEGMSYNPDYDWTLKRVQTGRSYSVTLSYSF